MQQQRSPSETSLMHYGYVKRTDIFALEVPEPHQCGIIADLGYFLSCSAHFSVGTLKRFHERYFVRTPSPPNAVRLWRSSV